MTLTVAGLPALSWTNGEGDASLDADGALVLRSAPGVDWTDDALGGEPQHGATSLAFEAPDEFTLSSRITIAGPRTTFDAGALALWSDPGHWAKICFENSPQGETMIVTVVTNGWSDDVNSTVVEGDATFVRVTRVGPGWAFHSSDDGVEWRFVRQFRLEVDGPVQVGFLAQAPQGDTCEARFDRIVLGETAPADLRDGS
jgi:regulation of enolase protein 1 (concanavalin A-like superfamily)